MNDLQLNIILKENSFYLKHSDHGLYDEYDQLVTQADIAPFAEEFEVEPPEFHAALIQIAKTNQMNRQKELSAENIFSAVNEQLKGKKYAPTLGRNEIISRLLNNIVKALDDNMIYVATNERRAWIMPCLNQKIITRSYMLGVFGDLIELSGVEDILNPNSEAPTLLSYFQSKLARRQY